MEYTERELVLAGEDGEKRWRATRVGTELLTAASREGGKKPRETAKRYESEDEATRAFEKAVRKKLQEGFAQRRDRAAAAPGEVVLHLLTRYGASSAFDLHPDGHTLVIADVLPAARGATLHLVDVATGRRRAVHSESGDERQTFVHAALFDASGDAVVYALNSETRRLDLRTGETRVLASYEQWRDAQFNPFNAHPGFDAARTRLLVFDAGDRARVLDADGRERFARSTAAPTNKCLAGALSPSGRKLALYRVSRGLMYGHDDARSDTTNAVEVWDVDAGRLEHTVPVDAKLDRVGFDPTDTRLLTNLEYAQGPVAYDLATGARVWQIEDPYDTDRLNTCFSWAYAPDGSSLAVGGRGLRLLDAERRASTPLEGVERQRVYRAVFSRDGTLLASGGDQGQVFVRRV